MKKLDSDLNLPDQMLLFYPTKMFETVRSSSYSWTSFTPFTSVTNPWCTHVRPCRITCPSVIWKTLYYPAESIQSFLSSRIWPPGLSVSSFCRWSRWLAGPLMLPTCGHLCFLFQHMCGWSVELYRLQLPRFVPSLGGWLHFFTQTLLLINLWWW